MGRTAGGVEEHLTRLETPEGVGGFGSVDNTCSLGAWLGLPGAGGGWLAGRSSGGWLAGWVAGWLAGLQNIGIHVFLKF